MVEQARVYGLFYNYTGAHTNSNQNGFVLSIKPFYKNLYQSEVVP